MKTINEVFAAFKTSLAGVYDGNEIEAITLMATLNEITGSSKAQLKAFTDTKLSSEQTKKLNNILIRLQTGEPIQYILGHAWFYGLTFKVNSSVLIPRPETEELVEWILQSKVKSQKSKVKILDIGTGSGCIAISLKANLTGARVSGMDISKKALQTARENAELNKIEVDFFETDILNIKSEIENPEYNIIVSNPPYVTMIDKKLMHNNVTDFEPHIALFVPENDPLIFYKDIADFALKKLISNGLLFFEINENLGKETVDLLEAKGFKNIALRKDMNGKDRMIKATV